VKAAAQTFRQNPKINTEEAITQLAVGEALVSMLEGRGVPGIVERALIAPPMAQVGPISPAARSQAMNRSGLRGKYDSEVERESAYEVLMKRKGLDPANPNAPPAAQGGLGGMLEGILGGGARPAPGRGRAPPKSMAEQVLASATKSVASTVGRQIGAAIVRGVLGSILGGRR
jgi:hypothetical protein